jgi:hypothetical protein
MVDKADFALSNKEIMPAILIIYFGIVLLFYLRYKYTFKYTINQLTIYPNLIKDQTNIKKLSRKELSVLD